jgi:hypothetical protein
MRRPWLGNCAKWACAAAFAATLVTWGASVRWELCWQGSFQNAGLELQVSNGCVQCFRFPGGSFLPEWYLGDLHPSTRWRTMWKPMYLVNRLDTLLLIPLWIPMSPVLCAAAALWYGDIRARRRGRDTCRSCGYDRRGLAADAKCPECGTVPAPATK